MNGGLFQHSSIYAWGTQDSSPKQRLFIGLCGIYKHGHIQKGSFIGLNDTGEHHQHRVIDLRAPNKMQFRPVYDRCRWCRSTAPHNGQRATPGSSSTKPKRTFTLPAMLCYTRNINTFTCTCEITVHLLLRTSTCETV